MGNRRIALIVAVAVCLPFGLNGCGEIPFPTGESVSTAAPVVEVEEAAVPSGLPRGPIVGTYRLAGRNVKDDDGAWVPTPDFNSLGYITYSDTGYMAVNVMPLDRPPFADDGGPTPEEAQAALEGYTAYFGPFSVNEDAEGGFLVHHRIGQMDPGGEVDAKRFYDLEGDRLILTPATAAGTKGDATRQVVWERLPDAELSEEAQRFVGFRQLLFTDRYEQRGSEFWHGQRNDGRAGSWILYTPTGHMMVHLMAREGRMPYAGGPPLRRRSWPPTGPTAGTSDGSPCMTTRSRSTSSTTRKEDRGRSRGDGRRTALPPRRRRPAARGAAPHDRGGRDSGRPPLLGATAAPAGIGGRLASIDAQPGGSVKRAARLPGAAFL